MEDSLVCVTVLGGSESPNPPAQSKSERNRRWFNGHIENLNGMMFTRYPPSCWPISFKTAYNGSFTSNPTD